MPIILPISDPPARPIGLPTTSPSAPWKKMLPNRAAEATSTAKLPRVHVMETWISRNESENTFADLLKAIILCKIGLLTAIFIRVEFLFMI
jgi:hypothetical protein